MPRRRTQYRRISAPANRRETQRRAALAIVGFVAVLGVLGVALWYWGPLRTESPVEQVTEGESALAAANAKAVQVFGAEDLMSNDPAAAQELLEDAWDDLGRAATAEVDPASIQLLRERVRSGLDELYETVQISASQIYAAPTGVTIAGLVRGPDDAAYAIVGDGVVRIDPDTGGVATIVQIGDGGGQGIGAPRMLARGGPELLIIDVRGDLWRWRPSDELGAGTLGQVRVGGDQVWGEGVVDVETFVTNPDQGLYRLYVPYPPSAQILRYDPTADGSGFSAPLPYFVSEGEDVDAFQQLHIDGDVYAVTSDNLLRYFNGRRAGFELDPPPDAQNIRPDHDYALMAATGTRGVGRLFIWDRMHSRVLVYEKIDGTYVDQFIAADGAPPLADVIGMYIVDRGQVEPPILVWARPEGIYQAVLVEPVGFEPSPSPSAPPPSTASPPRASPTPAGPTVEPTQRPRRTPRGLEPSPTP